jgi:hypothetical protein
MATIGCGISHKNTKHSVNAATTKQNTGTKWRSHRKIYIFFSKYYEENTKQSST